jgi:hypothetical protein
MDEHVAYREKYWWEHYPLHQIWCNDVCPIVPRFEYRPGDEWNSNNWSVHWLLFHVWSLEHFSFGADINVSFDGLSFGLILPYLRIIVGVRHQYYNWTMKINDLLRRKPAKEKTDG